MKQWPRTRLALFLSLILAILAALWAASRYLFDASPARLLIAAFLILAAGGLSLPLNRVTRDPAFADRVLSMENRRRLLWPALVLLLAAGAAAALPAYRLPVPWGAYLDILRPALLWLAALGGGALALLVLLAEARPAGEWRAVLQPASLILAGFLLLWLIIRLTDLGLGIREDYWYGAGVPALPLQVLASLIAGWLVTRLIHSTRRGLDALIFLLVWGLSALLWAREPLRASFFLPGPFRPNGDFYPFSDGSLFDLGGQFALIGQGLVNGQVYDRVLYMAFSAYLHALAGQRFVTVMAVQAALFAVFPAILYLLGRELNGRGLGASLAVLTALRGVNSIAGATWMDTVNPKMTMTDFPTAIGVALFALMLIRWLKYRAAPDDTRRSAAVWAGGALGLTLMLRVHVLLLLPAAVVLALFALRFQWRRWLPGVLLLTLGMVAATTPWDLRNHSKGAPLFDVYFHSIRIVLQARYGWPPIPTPQTLKVYPARNDPGVHGDLVGFGDESASKPLGSIACPNTPCRIVNHFLHNAVTSVLYLPASPVLDDLKTTVKESLPFWLQDWRGEGVNALSGTFIFANLALLALGIALAWRRARWVGWIPLGLYLAYILSNALAQTSGGRYIVPADWVIALYFLWGAGEVVNWIAMSFPCEDDVRGVAPEERTRGTLAEVGIATRNDVIVAFVGVLLLGSLVPMAEHLFPRRYAPSSSASTLQPSLNLRSLDAAALDQFLAQPGAAILQGRALYPRLYDIGKGETASDFPYHIQPYPRIAFTLIGPEGQSGVALPGRIHGQFASGTDVLVLGCYTPVQTGGLVTGLFDALAVRLYDADGTVYLRDPLPPLECPLRAPVCVDQETCY